MIQEHIQKLLDTEPFVTIEVVTDNGIRYTIQNPGLVSFEGDVLMVCRPKSNRYDLIWLFHIAAVEVLDPPA